jgi:hypothetical protein
VRARSGCGHSEREHGKRGNVCQFHFFLRWP